ncbi:proton-conducting transporter membrane subunit [Thermococcus sp. MAR1]|uniref:proton-conducting transporter transmembrane domain-containing protein n=1 Tax=Thermococcus sp. MAR1 TaxID=1638263 RepID=UPI00143BAC10|nr:proton-conducting transporter membrane subunit [Thermococcus sp. MAR1]NJE09437.1 monovalent cation/H+ antiporter subunit D family protein [Thermococcus sp. MAR1]
MIPLMVAFPLLFGFIIVILDTLRARKVLIKASFILGAVLPAGIFLTEIGKSEIVGGWNKTAGIEVGIGEINAPFIVGELILFTLVALYSLSYFDFRDKKTAKALVLFLLMHAGLLGAFLARDFFNFYIYMEIASVSAFALVAFSGEKGAKRAAFKYLMLSLLASYLFVFAVGIIYMETGYLNVGLIAENARGSRELQVALGIALSALILKAGIFPLHGWLPDAHSKAQTPVSAVLSGAVVKAPAYGMILLLSTLPTGETLRFALLVVAVASIFFGIVMALLQRDAKRLLAYHTVSQMGYVLLGIASLNFLGAAYYAMAHSIFKGGLFLSIGSMGKGRKLGTFGYRGDAVMAASVIVLSLAIGGVSPLIGAYGKGLIYSGLTWPWKLAVPLGSVGTLVSFTKLNSHLAKGGSGKVPASWKLPVLGLALTALAGGIYLGLGLDPKDVIYLPLALLIYQLLGRTGFFEKSLPSEGGEVGKEVNRLTAVLVAFILLLALIQGL